jgi:lantibiotic modifying enzyme
VTGAAWQPLLVGDAARDARSIVDDIAAALAARAPSPLPGLKGDAATVLLLAECGSPAAGPRLEQALLTAAAVPLTISLFGGLAGNAWVLHQLAEGPEVTAVLEHFDAALSRHLTVPAWHDRNDLTSGLAGVGVMLVAREDARARHLAHQVLAHLEATALEAGAGVTWRTEPQFLPPARRAMFPQGTVDLGVAHGMPGIIGMLAQFVEAGIAPERSEALLRRAIAWLLAAVPPACPRFGASWPLDDGTKRIGWCHGDCGIAGVLLLASRALDAPELARDAVALLQQSIAPLAQRKVPDAGFCHGAAGLAHIYNLAFQRTGDGVMREQALRWLHEVIGVRSPGTGIAGYASLDVSGPAPRREDDVTLLSGVVGTALVLLAAIEDRDPAWQQLFVM